MDRQAVGDAQEIPVPTLTSLLPGLAAARADSRPRNCAAMRPAALPCGYLAAIACRKAASAVLPPAAAVTAAPVVPVVPVPAKAGPAQPSRAAAATSPDITILRT